jgi:hypothetical protein
MMGDKLSDRTPCVGCSQPPPRAGKRTPAPMTAQPWCRQSAGNTPTPSECCRMTRCMLNACVRGATVYRASRRPPIPLVIRANCRAPRLTMVAANAEPPSAAQRREEFASKVRFAPDSPLEEEGYSNPRSPVGDSIFSRPPRNPATTNRPGSQNRILTIDKGRFTVRRARLAPAVISTPGYWASRRRLREALPAWSLFGL